jgi:hypothetical protein
LYEDCAQWSFSDVRSWKTQIIVDFKVIRDWNKWMLMLNQALYIMKILSEKKMQNCSAVEVSMKLKSYITLNEMNNVMKVSSVNLQWIVEKLMYIACETWSNIVFMIECLSQNLIDAQIEHIKAVKWVMWYLRKIISYDLRYESVMNIYTNQTQNMHITMWTATMWKHCELKIYYEICVHVEWWSAWMLKKQHTISTLTTEAEYIALEHDVRQEYKCKDSLIS